MKRLPLLLLVLGLTSCDTLVTRRDLYSPEPGPDSYERARQLTGQVTTTTTTTTTTAPASEAPSPPPPFR